MARPGYPGPLSAPPDAPKTIRVTRPESGTLALEADVCVVGSAGAAEIFSSHRQLTGWRGGEDLDAFAREVHDAPLAPHEHATFALHQMGSARMGADPDTSVANPWGELHDVPGVWIGDASAFPTASGTNPMITIMALARRTAQAIRDGADAS